ncbi:phage protein [Streptococcus pyogenes]|nr:phage protein [Streptococcus pyogenes]
MYFGQLVYETKKAQNTRLQEEKKVEEQRKAEEEQKQLEDSMIKHIQEEAKKTWYQRLGDSIQDQWWNFKGWLRG